jgi:hypothetical protein
MRLLPWRKRHYPQSSPRRFVIPRVEPLEGRLAPAGTITLTNAFVVNANNQASTPDIGEEVFIQADFTTQNLPSNASYRVSYTLDGVTLYTGYLNWGAGLSGTGNWNAVWGGWFATAGTHNVNVTIDPTTYGVTSQSFSFTPVSAPDLPQKFITPLGGTPFQTWNFVNYVDLNPLGGSAADFTGGDYVYDGHQGHDMTLANFGSMDAGVPDYAAAAGTVTAVQDGNYDRNNAFSSAPANYVIIDHGNGWQTEYFHFRTDTILVHVGDHVVAGQVLGLAGSSGDSTLAHLHFQVMHNGDVVEPELDPNTFWVNPLPYQGTISDVLDSGVTSSHSVATADLNAEERPVAANTFSQAGNQQFTVWFQGNTRPSDQVVFHVYDPSGTEDAALDYSFTASESHGGYWYYTGTLPANLTPGTWHVGININGTQMAYDPFQVTAAGAGAAHVTQGNLYVPNGRTTPVDFGTWNWGDLPPQLVFPVANLGSAPLNLSNLALPTGFTLVTAFPKSIAAGGSANFTVQMGTNTVAIKAGVLSFTTNDPNAPTYSFDIHGVVSGGNPGAIHGQVFEDFNNDAIENGADVGLPGWTVSLLDTSNNLLSTTTASYNGYYAFNNLPAGVYRVRMTAPAGWYQSTPNPADVVVGSADVLASPLGFTPAALNHLVLLTQPSSVQAGSVVSPAVQVEAIDQFGNVLATDQGRQFTVSVANGPGGFTSGSTLSATDVNGIATFNNLVLTTAGSYTLRATVGGALGSVDSLAFTVRTGSADRSQSTASVNPTVIPVGGTTTVTLQTADVYGNRETGGGLAVGFHVGAGSGNGTFGPVTDKGDGTYSATFTGTATGQVALVATIGGQDVTSAPPTLNVVPVSLSLSTVSVAPGSVRAGTRAVVTLQATDGSGVNETSGGLQVTFALGSGTGRGNLGPVTDNGDGTYSAPFTGTTAGTVAILAAIGGQAVTSTPPTVTVTPAPATHLALVTPAQTLAGGQFTATASTVDDFGNLDPSFVGSVALALQNAALGGKLTGATVAPVRNGVATFSHLSFNAVGSGYQLYASSTADLVGILSSPIAVPVTTHLSLTGVLPGMSAGQSFRFSVTALDAHNHTDTGYLGTIHFTSTDPHAVLPPDYTFRLSDHGTGVFPVTLMTAGPQTVSVVDVTRPTSRAVGGVTQVSPAPVSVLKVTGYPTQATVGVPHPFTVTAQDGYGNRIANYGGTVQFSLTGGTAQLPQVYAFTPTDHGSHTFAATLTSLGSGPALTASEAGQPNITGTESGITGVSPATHLGFSPVAGATAGQSFTVAITALDASNHPDTLFGDIVHFTSSDPHAVLPADQALTGGSATFSVTMKTAGPQTIRVTDVSRPQVKGTSPALAVSAQAASQLVLTAGTAPPVFGVPYSVTVTAEDPYGNPAASYHGTVQFMVTGGSALVPGPLVLNGPSGRINITPPTLASLTLNASDGSHTAALPLPVMSAATHLAISGVPKTIQAGQPFTLTVSVLTATGQVATPFNEVLHLADTAGATGLPPDQTFTGGPAQATFTLTLPNAGRQTITVSDASRSDVKAASVTLVLGPANNGVTPTAGISGPTTGVRGQPLTFTLTATENGQPANAVYTFRIDWLGNGSLIQTIAGASGLTVSQSFPATGTFAPRVVAVDPAGDAGPAAVGQPVTIQAAALEADPADGAKTALVIGGTTGNDVITISPADPTGQTITVSINGAPQGTFAPTGHVVVYGQAGNDTIQEVSQVINSHPVLVAVPALLFGGTGNDVLSAAGSSVSNVLVGGSGNDLLTAGRGQDILIGGGGAAVLRGGLGGDLLIGGSTIYDANAAALLLLAAEWGRTDIGYQQRVQDLFGNGPGGLNGTYLLNAQTVLPHAVISQVFGGSGADWYWFSDSSKAIDQVTGPTNGEVATFE